MNEAVVKAQGAYEAWMDLLSCFTEKQRMEIAHMLAHGWQVNGVRVEKQGAYKVYTPEARHSKGSRVPKSIKKPAQEVVTCSSV